MDYPKEQAEFMKILLEARNEWLEAQSYFQNVSEPDLVDYAIYKIEAAKRKYMYLLKQARISGFESTQITDEPQGKMIH